MGDAFARAVEALSRLKTPLSVSGISLLVLYGIVDSILSLSVFESIGGDNTYIVISSIIDKAFYISIAGILLGVAGFVSARFIDRKNSYTSSRITLVHSGLDPNSSLYEQVQRDAKVEHVRPREGTTNDDSR